MRKMAEIAKNKLERTKLDYMESGGTTFEIKYISMESQVQRTTIIYP